MKKYLLGLVAIVVAISLSAFTGKKEVKSSRVFNTYGQWYHTTDNGTKVGDRFYNSTPIEKTSVTGSGCDDDIMPVCAVGSNSTLTLGADIPEEEGSADNYILETDN